MTYCFRPAFRASPLREQGTSTVERLREVSCGFPLLALRAGRKRQFLACALALRANGNRLWRVVSGPRFIFSEPIPRKRSGHAQRLAVTSQVVKWSNVSHPTPCGDRLGNFGLSVLVPRVFAPALRYAKPSLRGETPISRASPQREQGTSTVDYLREVSCGFPLLAQRAGRIETS